MFENLQNRLEKAFKSLKGQGRINELNVAETVKEIRRALIAADRKSTRLNSSHVALSRMPSSA